MPRPSLSNMAQTEPLKPRRIAVVGGGISGIGCLWGLRHKNYDVHLYEADSRLGGHANTVMFDGCGHSVPVDTGFIAMNEKTYRKLSQFTKRLAMDLRCWRYRMYCEQVNLLTVVFMQLSLLLFSSLWMLKPCQPICHLVYLRMMALSNGGAHLSGRSSAVYPASSDLGSGGSSST